MIVFVVFRHDRHVDPGITVHSTRDGADLAIEEFKAEYADMEYAWTEKNYDRAGGRVRYVACGSDDGPNARIEKVELQP